MKTRKVLEIKACGNHLKGFYEEGKMNPWRLYKMAWRPRKDGCGLSEHKEMVGKWANFISMTKTIGVYFDGNAEAWRD